MRVVFCGGGTGGHVYPALTVATALRRLVNESLELLYIGVAGKMDAELVAREDIPFAAITARPLRVGSLTGTARGGLALVSGVSQAATILRRFNPDVVFATGGYGSVGVGLAARLQKRPLLLFLPDVEPGLAVKALTRVATRIAVTNEPALAAMPPAKTEITGYPVRAEFFEGNRDEARHRLGLDPALPVLLVSGASSGASRINQAVIGWAASFLQGGQIIHICGANDDRWLQREREKMPAEARGRYHLYPYLHEMAFALRAADIAVMRSGASTLGELPATGLPAILVPGEYEGWDQSPNARYLADKGAAVMLPQSQMESHLQKTTLELLADQGRRDRMKDALGMLARPDAASRLAGIVTQMASSPAGVVA
jgi:UDP-N-acetylglucosamine--N-acetylmuramyl-(pentapeptide) pyrophosphoryl-undecaprenol N-acetylglucosamine transferase